MWQRYFSALDEWQTSQKSSYMTVPTCSTFVVQLLFLLWSPVCFSNHVADSTTPSGPSFRGALMIILPLLRFFNEWGGWGHSSAASSLHICYLTLEVLQADTLHNSTQRRSRLAKQKYSLGWIGHYEAFSEWFRWVRTFQPMSCFQIISSDCCECLSLESAIRFIDRQYRFLVLTL